MSGNAATRDGGWHRSHYHAARLSPHTHTHTHDTSMQECTPARTEGEGIHPSVHLKKLLASVDRTGEPYTPTTTHTCLLMCVCTHMCVAGWLGRTGRMLHTSFSARTSVHTCSEGMHGTQAGQVCPTYKYRHSHREKHTHGSRRTHVRTVGSKGVSQSVSVSRQFTAVSKPCTHGHNLPNRPRSCHGPNPPQPSLPQHTSIEPRPCMYVCIRVYV